VVAGGVKANEGTAELRNTTGDRARCWVASVLLKTFSYHVVVSCRDLIYPVDENVFDYVLWINPVGRKVPEKLGSLGVGKAQFDTRLAFASMFVTKEGKLNPIKPGPVAMQGNIGSVPFLEVAPGEPTLTPIPTPLRPSTSLGTSEGQAQGQEQGNTGLAKGVQVGTTVLKIVGIAFLLGLGAVIVVIVISGMGDKKSPPKV